ncbi:universal stress protein [Salipiger aestuarii]|uniref:Nucleotide-binding universal stress UspA family protein n=1 Tax=Salipiger aestuarii TaxID=568098 RepID=A0A327YDV1_9RHOB|nr:universal stress protein [Salipiger aestuarii]EIE53114.1 universal stress protein family protein [Citreicella sp. 357]KAA8608706.1 universal stress protein [Salipiger aestuarii]KAA8613061.1 universal stress protein [Salipiger aestuarii]KAB2542531.1 universal stress protein [Salipiger aestuarii]RAK19004.1 nucleotide-binding universal stress UspA family protein [Salipiger aestuarii]
MGYKTILTVVTDQSLAQSTIGHAAAVARDCDAHLDVLCFGVDRTQTGYYYAGANAMVLQETLSRATDEAKTLAASCRDILGRIECRWAVEEGVAQLADIGRHVAGRARYADLVVLPKPYGKDRGVELEPVTEGALFDGQASVLIVPEDTVATSTPKRVVIGWNESNEALRSVRAALPVLKTAESVHVVVIDPPQHGPNRSDPGGALSQFLARHGAKPEIDVLSKTMPRVSEVLRRHVQDVDAEMVVMGAYGHSRFREAILGGATRNMLEQATVPVFLAH